MEEKESLNNLIRTLKRDKRSTKCGITNSNIELSVIKTVETMIQPI